MRRKEEKEARKKKKVRATKGTGTEPSDMGVQEGLSTPSSECPIELLPSSSQQPTKTLALKKVSFKGDEPSLGDCSITIIIPGGVTSKERVQRITDGIKSLVQEDNYHYYSDDSWPNVLEGGSQHLIRVSFTISFAPIRCLDFLIYTNFEFLYQAVLWMAWCGLLSRLKIALSTKISTWRT